MKTKIINFIVSLKTKAIKTLKAIGNYIQFKMGYILLPLSLIQFDKQKHAAAGIWISAAGFLLSMAIFQDKLISFIIGFGLSLLAGAIKEHYDDRKNDNEFDWIDLLSTGIGGLFACILLSIIYK